MLPSPNSPHMSPSDCQLFLAFDNPLRNRMNGRETKVGWKQRFCSRGVRTFLVPWERMRCIHATVIKLTIKCPLYLDLESSLFWLHRHCMLCDRTSAGPHGPQTPRQWPPALLYIGTTHSTKVLCLLSTSVRTWGATAYSSLMKVPDQSVDC